MDRRRGRWAWLGALLAIAVVGLLAAAWIEGGSKPMRWIEQPVAPPDEQG